MRQPLPTAHLQVKLRELRRYRERLAFSVELGRGRRAWVLDLAGLVEDDLVLEVRVQAVLGRIAHRASMVRVLKKACVRDLARMQLVRQWDLVRRDRQAKGMHGRRVIVRRDSIVGHVLIEDRVLIVGHGRIIVDRARRVRKALRPVEIVRRDRKAQAIVRRDLIEDRDLIEGRDRIEDRDRITEDRVPKVEGRRMLERPKVELQFRRPNRRPRSKQRLRSSFRRPNRLHRRSRCKMS